MNNTFLKACKGERTSYTPVWLMRQAGRYLPEYQKIRQKVDFLTLCKTPELAAEVTLQPVEILGVDAAILFSDILIPIEPLGFDLEFSERLGPVIHNPFRSKENLSGIREFQPDTLSFVRETIKLLKESLKVPLIGFSGAPFTLATYVIEGGSSKNFVQTKRLMYSDSPVFEELMERLTEVVEKYLLMQIEAGVDAVQLFDTWLGILSGDDILTITSKYVSYIIEKIKKASDVPIIYFPFNCGTSLRFIKDTGADVIGLDWRIDIETAIQMTDRSLTMQGNLDPCVLFGSKETIKKKTLDILKASESAKGHIFNLGHGILPETPVDNVKYLVDTVHQLSSKETRDG